MTDPVTIIGFCVTSVTLLTICMRIVSSLALRLNQPSSITFTDVDREKLNNIHNMLTKSDADGTPLIYNTTRFHQTLLRILMRLNHIDNKLR